MEKTATSSLKQIYKAAVLTILLYGSEVWNTTKKQLHRFEVFHQRCLRRILRIKWLDRVRNTEVLERAKINPVETFIRSNRLRWFGHVTRMPDTIGFPSSCLTGPLRMGEDLGVVQERTG